MSSEDTTGTDQRRPRHLGRIALAGLLLVGIVAFVGARQLRCRPVATEHSAARTWNEQLLSAIRRDFPAPTVHARNLYHHAVLLWDLSVLTDDNNDGEIVLVNVPAVQPQLQSFNDEKRAEALHYASYRFLSTRYARSTGAEETQAALDAQMDALCLAKTADDATSDAAIAGFAVADHLLEITRNDGSLEPAGYVDLSYAPVNPPLLVNESGIDLPEPNRWQPLSLDTQVTQNGLSIAAGPQVFIGPNWGSVTPFALTPSRQGLPIDPGPPPLYGADDAFAIDAIEVIDYSRRLDTVDAPLIRSDPGAIGNAPLGEYDGNGHEINPVTGEPYEAVSSTEADYGRVVAEYWADGPDSETPPGHWNTMANEVGDQLVAMGEPLAIDGQIMETRLDWDLRIYLGLNGALHDAAIAAWGAKAHYDYVRPISIIRYLGTTGQLPETPGLVEVITAQSSSPGERHQHLNDHVGETAVISWIGQPDDPDRQLAGVDWVLADDWVPYQRDTFVTPSFAGYVSGHSTFSRAAADVLTAATGSPYFPGGLFSHTVEPGGLIHEFGPTADVTLQWATYQDAADEAGRSRLYGGIHVRADDLEGRKMGAEVATTAWARAQEIFG